MAKSIFADSKKSKALFTTYDCTVQFRDKILGGTPKNPKIIEGWLRAKTGVTDDEEIRQMMFRTLVDMGVEVTPEMSYDELVEASEALASVKQTNGFKQNGKGLYIEDRQVKACLKEAVSILYPWAPNNKWGETKKAARSYFVETVFVNPREVLLGLEEPTGVEMMMVHAKGANGVAHSINYSEFASEPEVSFQVQVLRDSIGTTDKIKNGEWAEIWTLAQELGLGAGRSQGFGRFDVIKWDKTN